MENEIQQIFLNEEMKAEVEKNLEPGDEIIGVKQYYVCEVRTKNKKGCLTTINNGYEPLELLGLLEYKKEDVIQQMRGEIKPDFVKRIVVED